MRFTLRWLTCVCLSMMFWTAVAESTHNHPTQTEAISCSICIAAHSTAPVVSMHFAKPLFEAVGLLHEEEVLAKAPISIFELGIRGPPAV
jgi:hypothetical protein